MVMLLRHKSYQTSILVCFMVRPKPFVGLSSSAEIFRRREEEQRKKAGRKESDVGSLAGACKGGLACRSWRGEGTLIFTFISITLSSSRNRNPDNRIFWNLCARVVTTSCGSLALHVF